MVRNCLRKSKHRRKGDPEVAALIRRLLAEDWVVVS